MLGIGGITLSKMKANAFDRISLNLNDMNLIYQLFILLAISIGMVYISEFLMYKKKIRGFTDLSYAFGMVMTAGCLAVFFQELGLSNVIAFWLTVIVSYLIFLLPIDIITYKAKKRIAGIQFYGSEIRSVRKILGLYITV